MKLALPVSLGILLLAGCGEENRTPVAYTPSVEKNARSSNDTTAPLRPIASAQSRPPRDSAVVVPAAATFSPTPRAPGPAPSGSAALFPAGGKTRVDVALSGGLSGEHYVGEIRAGECGRIGPFVAALNTVTSDASGAGRASTWADVPIDSLAVAPHVLVYGRDGRVELCAPVRPGR